MDKFIQWAEERIEQALTSRDNLRAKNSSLTSRHSQSRHEGIAQGVREAQQEYLRLMEEREKTEEPPTFSDDMLDKMSKAVLEVCASAPDVALVEMWKENYELTTFDAPTVRSLARELAMIYYEETRPSSDRLSVKYKEKVTQKEWEIIFLWASRIPEIRPMFI